MGHSGLQPVNLFLTLFPFLLSTLIVGTRIWRRIVDHRFAIDDALILVAQILMVGLTTATWIFIMKSYTGYRLEDIPKGAINKLETAKWRYINAVIYNPILGLIKISFLLTLINLQSPNRGVRIALWALVTINTMYMIGGTLIAMLNCRPIARFWDRRIPGHCVEAKRYIYATISITIVTDLLVTLMPIAIIRSLQMPRRTKIIIICFLSLGLLVTAIASYRLANFVKVFSNPDPVRNESPYNIRTPLANIEANLAVIAACGPTLKWALGRCIPFFDTSSDQSSKKYTPDNSLGTSAKHNKQRSRRGYKESVEATGEEITVSETEFDIISKDNTVLEKNDRMRWNVLSMKNRREHETLKNGLERDEHDSTKQLNIVETAVADDWDGDVGRAKSSGKDSATQPRHMV